MTIGERIKNTRKIRGYTQKTLSEMCGIAEPTIRKYESGRLNPKQVTLEKFAAALNCSVEYLRNGTGPKPQTYKFESNERLRGVKDYRIFSAIDNSLLIQYIFFIKDEQGKPLICNADEEVEHAERHNDIILNTKIPSAEKDRLRIEFCNILYKGKCTPYIHHPSDKPSSQDDFERLWELFGVIFEGSTITVVEDGDPNVP